MQHPLCNLVKISAGTKGFSGNNHSSSLRALMPNWLWQFHHLTLYCCFKKLTLLMLYCFPVLFAEKGFCCWWLLIYHYSCRTDSFGVIITNRLAFNDAFSLCVTTNAACPRLIWACACDDRDLHQIHISPPLSCSERLELSSNFLVKNRLCFAIFPPPQGEPIMWI